MSKKDEQANDLPTVVLLGGISDRQLVACARSLEEENIDYVICPPKFDRMALWRLTSYRYKITDTEYVKPEEDPEKFISSISELAEKMGPMIIFPFGEPTHKELSKIKHKLPEDVVVPLPEYDTLVKLDDKNFMTKLASEHGISTPERYHSIPSQSKLPFVVNHKTESFDGFDSVTLVTQKEDLQIIKEKRDSNISPEEVFIQEYIEGTSYYYCCIFCDGKLVSDYSKKVVLQQPGGRSVIKARPAKLPTSVAKKLQVMAGELNWTGPLMAEFRHDGDEYKIIEINPRFWGPLQMLVDNNVHFPAHLYFAIQDYNISIEKRDHYGYFRLDALINGYWQRFLDGSDFYTTKTPEDDKYQYKLVWGRKDTLPIFGEKIFRSTILRAVRMSVGALNSPDKAYKLIRKRLSN